MALVSGGFRVGKGWFYGSYQVGLEWFGVGLGWLGAA